MNLFYREVYIFLSNRHWLLLVSFQFTALAGFCHWSIWRWMRTSVEQTQAALLTRWSFHLEATQLLSAPSSPVCSCLPTTQWPNVASPRPLFQPSTQPCLPQAESPPLLYLCLSCLQMDSSSNTNFSQNEAVGNSLVVQWLELRVFTAEGLGSIRGQRTKIPQATGLRIMWDHL